MAHRLPLMDYHKERHALVEGLIRSGHLKSPAVIEAFETVPREAFMPRYLTHRAYEDLPIPIGYLQTISAPHMVAIMTEALEMRSGLRVLEVGTGSGYQAAILGHLARPGGRVVSVERIRVLAERARRALAFGGRPEVEVREGDGSLGYPMEAPYDRIVVTAAAPRPPPPLIDQLAVDGMLLLPVGDERCDLVRVRRSTAGFSEESLGACAFVPLRGAYGQGSKAVAT